MTLVSWLVHNWMSEAEASASYIVQTKQYKVNDAHQCWWFHVSVSTQEFQYCDFDLTGSANLAQRKEAVFNWMTRDTDVTYEKEPGGPYKYFEVDNTTTSLV